MNIGLYLWAVLGLGIVVALFTFILRKPPLPAKKGPRAERPVRRTKTYYVISIVIVLIFGGFAILGLTSYFSQRT